jgi:photosystem II stability/assembly factor-like uncharacterized protein
MPPATALPAPEISFVSSEEGWLSTGGYSSDCTAAHVDIWHTSDAGASWALLGSSGIAAKQCTRQLSFVDSVHGFLVGWENSSARVIYRTSDGAMTWSPSQPLQPEFTSHVFSPTLNVGLVRAFGPTFLVPAYGYTDTSGGIQAVFESTDGGATWYVATAKRGDDPIVLVSATRWLQLIGPGQSVETTDRYTWHSYASDYSQAAPVPPQIAFGDTAIGYATVRGEIQVTVDGGLHWTEIKTPGT